MLSNKELSYANASADMAPFPGESYAKESLEYLQQAFKNYAENYQNKEYDIIMSDGQSLTLEIMSTNICHMLGIDYKQVINTIQSGITNLPLLEKSQLNSYSVLNYIMDHIDEIIKFDRRNKLRLLNYFKIMIKSTIFMSFSDFTAFDFGIIKFDKDCYDDSKYKRFSSKSSILLFTPSKELVVPHYIMGLKVPEDNSNGNFIVETMYAHANVSEFMDGQELVLPTQILMTDKTNQELSKQSATVKEKLNLLRMYQVLINKARISCNINIFNDYESLLVESDNRQKSI